MSSAVSGPRVLLILLFFSVAPTAAMAYIDPGNGAYMVQALLTLIGAALFYLKHPVRTAKMLWARLVHGEKGDETDSTHEPPSEPSSPSGDRSPPAADPVPSLRHERAD